MKTKVLWICSPLVSRYGVMNIIRGWASAFDYDRYDVTLLFSSPDPAEVRGRLAEFPALRVESMPELGGLNQLYIPAIRKLIDRMRRDRIDVVHTVFAQADILGAVAAHIADVPVVVSSVMGYLVVPFGASALKTPIYKAAYALARRWIDRVTAITRTTGNELIRDFGVPSEKIEVLYSGIPLQEFPRPSSDRESFVIGSVGQLIPQKGVITIVEALPEVMREIPNVRLVVAGEGPEQSRLEARAVELGVRDRVGFVGFSETVPQLMATLDAFVFPSFPSYDGLPRVILEAMLQRTPVVAARTEPIEEIIVDRHTGRLFAAGNAADLSAALVETKGHEDQTRSMVERAHELVMKFSIENEVRQIERIYDRLVEEKRVDPAA